MQIGSSNNTDITLQKSLNNELKKEINNTQVRDIKEVTSKIHNNKEDNQQESDKFNQEKESQKVKPYRANELEFSIHKGTNRIMIKVINKETKEVVKEIPEEKILDMVAQMYEDSGICIDKKI